MSDALVFLAWRSARNRALDQLRRLRRPRYVIALALGAAYVWAVLARPTDSATARTPPGPWLELVAALVAMGAAAWAWLFASDRRALEFSPAEVTFLFPAPLGRRTLIHFKLLRNQVTILLNSLLWTLLLTREHLGKPWLRTIALWVLLTTLALHRLGASFVRASLAQHGRSGLRRRLVSVLAVLLASAALVLSAADVTTAVSAAHPSDVHAYLRALAAALARPIPAALLFPFRVAVRPVVSIDPQGWSAAIGPAALLMVAHYVWVVRSDTAFEEGAAAAALEQAGRPRRDARQRRRKSYRLGPDGWPAWALAWKNLVGVLRRHHPRRSALALGGAGAALAALSFGRARTAAEFVGWLVLTWAAISLVAGPQWVRGDLRGDLARLDLLRTYPLRGRDVMVSEAAGSALVLTATQLAMLVLVWLAFLGNEGLEVPLGTRTALLVGAAVHLPAVNWMAMLLQNAAAVLFPDWVRADPSRPGRVEALGQNMLTLIAFAVVLALALALPAALAAGTFVLLRPAIGAWAALPATPPALAALLWEGSFLARWAGGVFERTEPGAVAPAG